MLNSHACLRNMQTALRLGAKRALAFHDRPDRIMFPGKNGWISSAHEDIYQTMFASLIQAYPDHQIVPQGDKAIPQEAYVWAIEPIDGFDNFLSGIGLFTLSLLLYVNGKPTISAIYAPVTDELFSASLGSGAQLNGKKIRIWSSKSGTTPCLGLHNANSIFSILQDKMPKAVACMPQRQLGCFTLSVAYHASGRLACLLGNGFTKHSIAAAHLIAQESGSVGRFFNQEDGSVFCIFSPPGLLTKSFYHQLQDD